MKKLLVLYLMALTIVLASSSDALADDTICVGVLTGTYDNVVVPPNATCSLIGALVQGNVIALENSRLAIFLSYVRGNVEGNKAQVVQVRDSTVRENITIKEGGFAAAPTPPGALTCFAQGFPLTPCDALVIGSTVLEGNIQIEKTNGDVIVRQSRILKGNVKLEENLAPVNQPLIIDFTSVAQNIQVFKNRGPGAKIINSNTAGESVQCFDNDPPVVGGPNAAPRKEGQCF
jgi:hypothetical protein